jgi:hypothetical protein
LEDSKPHLVDPRTIPSGKSATIDITAIPTIPGEITNYVADIGENQASAMLMAE